MANFVPRFIHDFKLTNPGQLHMARRGLPDMTVVNGMFANPVWGGMHLLGDTAECSHISASNYCGESAATMELSTFDPEALRHAAVGGHPQPMAIWEERTRNAWTVMKAVNRVWTRSTGRGTTLLVIEFDRYEMYTCGVGYRGCLL